MTRSILDASAHLAFLLGEPGAEIVSANLRDALISSVNYAEVVSCFAKLGVKDADIRALFRHMILQVVPADQSLSFDAGILRPITIKGEGAPALTADGRWSPKLLGSPSC